MSIIITEIKRLENGVVTKEQIEIKVYRNLSDGSEWCDGIVNLSREQFEELKTKINEKTNESTK